MQFGLVPLKLAVGAILAHSVGTASGRLRKGLVLTEEHIETLRIEGHEQIIVAKPEHGDIPEDVAADRLAKAMAGPNVLRTDAFTGRVNLIAPGPGVAVLNAQAIRQLNGIDPMISCATVPEFQQMAQGGMIATVKIISYAVNGANLEAACEAARQSIDFAPVTLGTADLFITEVPGGPGSAGEDAIRGRLEALGMTLSAVQTCPHKTEPLSSRIAASTADLILVLTGSATSDPNDVAPSALRAAGGTVTRFGMPVDPGNLLFVGDRNGTPVIGLPGCARSPALNGADWVLSRIACGLPVSSDDIASMGVGGLLKEIPTRPQPRARRLPKTAS